MSTIPILRLFGFEIRIHVSWAIILAVLAVSVATQVERMDPSTSPLVRWLIGAVVAASLLVSALLHELGHAFVARRIGLPTRPVVIYFFGAAASPSLTTARPRDEVSVAIAGPLVSLGLGGGLLLVSVAASLAGPPPIQVAGEIAFVVNRHGA